MAVTTQDKTIRAGYKQTEVGVVPEEWLVESLVNCCDFVDYRGKTPRKTQSGTLLITARNVRKGFIDYEESKEYVATDQYDLIMRRGKPQIGDVIITTEAPLGNVAQIDREDVALAQRIIKYRPKRTDLCSNYLKHYLLSERFQGILDGHASGSTARGIKGSVLHQLPVVIPRPGEQEGIATALSEADALIASLDKLIAKKRNIKTAAMQQLLTGKQRLPGFSGGWELKRLGEVLCVRHGKSQKHVAVSDGQYPILATGGEIGRTNTVLYSKPSVLIGRKGTIDNPQFQESPFWTIDTLFYTEIGSAAYPKFIYYKFLTIDWRSYNEASGVPSLNASTIENIEFECPRVDEQIAIAAVLSEMDAEIVALKVRRDKTQALKQGMMQQLLTGKIRLI